MKSRRSRPSQGSSRPDPVGFALEWAGRQLARYLFPAPPVPSRFRRRLIAPRDFDISPYFAIVKPALSGAFDFKALEWRKSGCAGGALAA